MTYANIPSFLPLFKNLEQIRPIHSNQRRSNPLLPYAGVNSNSEGKYNAFLNEQKSVNQQVGTANHVDIAFAVKNP